MLGEDVTEKVPLQMSDVEVVRMPLADVRRHRAYVSKSSIWRFAPFDQCVLLDADTVVTGPIDELFNAPLTVTRFANWISTGRIVGGRIRQWLNVPSCELAAQIQLDTPFPAINTGVVGWHRDFPLLPEWERVTQAGWRCSFTDELGLQLFVPGFPEFGGNWDGAVLLDDRFNCSPVFGVNRDDSRIWHYHGRRMVRRPEAGELYRPHLLTALDANVGGIADWLPELDPALWDLAKRSPALAT